MVLRREPRLVSAGMPKIDQCSLLTFLSNTDRRDGQGRHYAYLVIIENNCKFAKSHDLLEQEWGYLYQENGPTNQQTLPSFLLVLIFLCRLLRNGYSQEDIMVASHGAWTLREERTITIQQLYTLRQLKILQRSNFTKVAASNNVKQQQPQQPKPKQHQQQQQTPQHSTSKLVCVMLRARTAWVVISRVR